METVKINKIIVQDVGLKIEYERDTDANVRESHIIDRNAQVHPDLQGIIDALKDHVIYSLQLLGLNTDNTKHWTEEEQAYFENLRQHMQLISVRMKGSFSSDNISVILSAKTSTQVSSQKIAMTTPTIGLNSRYTHVEELRELIEKLLAETEQYLLFGKKAQGELFDREENEDDDDDPENFNITPGDDKFDAGQDGNAEGTGGDKFE